jgi:prepilin-type N-terminal cleavage/methylation domain-containing protein
MLHTSNRHNSGFTLVEIMIVVAIIGLLAAIAVPSFIRARMRSQATTVLNEARQMDGGKDQWALENNKTGTATPAFADLTPYLKAGSKLATTAGNDSMGNAFIIGNVSTSVRVSVTTKDGVSDATGGNAFWGPYS